MSGLVFVLRPESFCIHRLPADWRLDPVRMDAAAWYSITRSEDELSVIAPEHVELGPVERECGWSCLQIQGIFDFGMIGILAGVSRILADANVSIVAVASYNTDHILIRTCDVDVAVRALTAAGHRVLRNRCADTGSPTSG